MSTKLNKYRNGKIYIIRSDQTDEIYIGSTVRSLKNRLREHESYFKAFNNGTYHYVTSFELLKRCDYKIELLEHHPCDYKHELERREGHFHKTVDCVNKDVAGRTRAEYYLDNKDTIREKQKQYQHANKAKIGEQRKQYQQTNKAKIQEHRKEKHICPCGGQYTTVNKTIHIKTKKHQKYETANL